MPDYTKLLHELDLIEAFGFWLKHSLPEWSISRPAIERINGNDQHPIFVLYQHGVSVGVYKTPIEALARIDNDSLTAEYFFLISSSDSQADSGAGLSDAPYTNPKS